MAKGWIRAYSDEYHFFKDKRRTRKERSFFRKNFNTFLYADTNENSQVLAQLHWGDELELPEGIGNKHWTKAVFQGQEGFVRRWHAVEIGYVGKNPDDSKNPYVSKLRLNNEDAKKYLLWGDLVQIRKREGDTCLVRARGWFGRLHNDQITEDALLDISFIDVGQGDGVLVHFPEGKHLLIDGGLARGNQMTGKNAADYVDWKFFFDYGHYCVKLDGMMASHCDADHYGGLWDLIKHDPAKDQELDCADVELKHFFHAGLSAWKKKDDTHKDGLGPTDNGWFVRLLNDRQDAENSIDADDSDTLGGNWKKFIADILEANDQTQIHRVGVRSEHLSPGNELPKLWPNESACDIKVLAPVTKDVGGKPALKDLGNSGINKNGHSICLRLDYGNARLLLTGDLNTASMNWLAEAYGDRISEFNCDVAKACHHGSHDISFKFLKHIHAGATIISSGDAEGYAHPRPEVVAASAVTGFMEVDEEKDRLITPLIYMTEIERSVSLGKVSHIRMSNFPIGNGNSGDKALLADDGDKIKDLALFSGEERKIHDDIEDPTEQQAYEDDIIDREKAVIEEAMEEQETMDTNARYHYRSVHKLFRITYGTQPVQKTRILTKNHYGLVNVRTDGETVMCATMKEAGGSWTIHTFKARF